jgi:hypothetical protein
MTLGGSATLEVVSEWDGTTASNGFGATYTIATYGTQSGTFATPTMAAKGGLDASAYIDAVNYADGTSSNEVTVTLKALVGGDADLSGKVDSDDVSVLNGNWLTTGKDWFSADFTGDGAVNSDDVSAINGNWLQEADSAAVGEGWASYDAATGQILVSGNAISTIGIVSDGNLLGDIGDVNWQHGFGTLKEDARPWRAVESVGGDVLPTFTDHAFFLATSGIAEGDFDFQVRYQVLGSTDILFADVNYIAVPEPGTMLLLLAGGCSLLVWRRRRA